MLMTQVPKRFMLSVAILILLSSLRMMSQATKPSQCGTESAEIIAARDRRRDQAGRRASGGRVAEGSSDHFLFGLAGQEFR